MSTPDGLDAILITGPTASGKSALAIDLALRHGGEIVNADSMQVYDTLSVLTARPGAADLAKVPHHLYGHVPATATHSTGAWLRDMEVTLDRLKQAGHVPVIVGGTGLYFRALTEGLADLPAIPPAIRDAFRARLAGEGAQALHGELARRDPVMAARLSPTDSQRILRALEVLETTGRSLADLARHNQPPLVDPSRAMKFVVLPDRAVLAGRINDRFATMFERGAVDEVTNLLAQSPSEEAPAMKAIGVPQIRAMLEGRLSRDEVIAQASAATRQYAKRQMTWFRNQMDETWRRIDPMTDTI